MSDLQTREQMLSELSHHNVIPEDAMKAAREAAAEAYPDARRSILAAMVDGLYMVPIIARAILAERERSRTALSEAEQRVTDAKLIATNAEHYGYLHGLEAAAKAVDDVPCVGPCYAHYDAMSAAIRALIPSEPHDAEGRP